MKPRDMKNGQYGSQGVSSGDLDQGFIADSSDIPEDGDNVFRPQSAMRKREMKEMMGGMMDKDDAGFEGGFLGRDQCGHDRY